jgi:hypothetical protein
VASSGGLEEAVNGDPYGVQWQAWRRPVPACSTAPELLQQCPAWRYRGGDGVPAGLTSWFDHAEPRERDSRVWPAPSRGCGALAVREWASQCHGADTGHVTQSRIWRGWVPPRELAEQRLGVIPRRMMARLCCVRALNARTHVREQARA